MKNQKIKIRPLKVKSFMTSTTSELKMKRAGTDGGYTWVG